MTNKINKIEKIIQMEKYINSFIKNKDTSIFKDIFIMYTNDLDIELEIIKNNKTKKGRKKVYNNNDFFYYSLMKLLENGQT